MATESPVIFPSAFSNVAYNDSLRKMINESGVIGEKTRTGPSRSGSAPPTIEGSIAALRAFMDQRNSTLASCDSGFFDCESEEQMRTDPSYITYYYANIKLNPRLPPPLISRENHHLAQLMGGFGNLRSGSIMSTHEEEPEENASPQQTLAYLTKGESSEIPSPASSTAVKVENAHDIGTASITDQASNMQESCSGSGHLHEGSHSINSHAPASELGASFRSNISAYSRNADVGDNSSTQSDIGPDVSELESTLRSLNVSEGFMAENRQRRQLNVAPNIKNNLQFNPAPDLTYQVPGYLDHPPPQAMHGFHLSLDKAPGMEQFLHNQLPVPPLYMTAAAYMHSRNSFYPGLQAPGFISPQFSPAPNYIFPPPYFGGYPPDSAFPVPIDPHSSAGLHNPLMGLPTGELNPYARQMLYLSRNLGLNGLEMQQIQQSFTRPLQGPLFQQSFFAHPSKQNSDAAISVGGKDLHQSANPSLYTPANESHNIINYYAGPHSFGIPHVQTPQAMADCLMSPGLQQDLSASQQFSKSMVSGSAPKGSTSSDDSRRPTFLELLKSFTSRNLELSDISGKIVELSTDQHGSRFIQQKLETCGTDEKASVFSEVLPHAVKLMTDVFGNYVIQKFFEYGTAEQRRRLGDQLTGQVLALSLQMYGCRVIQKALEVIELDQKTKVIQELDGHVMRCVHDQNGNHVIQKCIESVPAEKVGFIISSFRGQVEALSCHPYGCRVIQRVLEHCSDEQLIQPIVDEILKSTSRLAEDSYGNYVTQHVLEMGNAQERSQIIHELTGTFRQISQHKFASNVVEKCLKYGDAGERELIIEEMLEESDDHNALLMMIKDQFANYVIQKIFDVGNDKQKNKLINCIRTNLPVLKKFPYAKHTVARYEQISEGSVQEQK